MTSKPKRPWIITYYKSSKNDQFYAHVIGANGEIVLQSEGYADEEKVERFMEEFTKRANSGMIVVAPPEIEEIEETD